jgi:hypothetical protein
MELKSRLFPVDTLHTLCECASSLGCHHGLGRLAPTSQRRHRTRPKIACGLFRLHEKIDVTNNATMTGRLASLTSRHHKIPQESIRKAFGVPHMTATKTMEKISTVHRHRLTKRTLRHFGTGGVPPCCGGVSILKRCLPLPLKSNL